MERATSQKEIILDYLRSAKTHPSAKDVYLVAKKRLPRISMGTVYRVLKNLKEKGIIQEIPNKETHYDGNISPHGHFFCESCNKIFDVFEKCDIVKNKKLKVGKIKNYQIYFYGNCKKCSNR